MKEEKKTKWRDSVKAFFSELFGEFFVHLLFFLCGVGIVAVVPFLNSKDVSFDEIMGFGVFGALGLVLIFGAVLSVVHRRRGRVFACASCKMRQKKESIASLAQYEAALSLLRDRLDAGEWELLSCTCPPDRVKTAEGGWVSDYIFHTVKCKTCGTAFTLSVDTCHGRGSFDRIG